MDREAMFCRAGMYIWCGIERTLPFIYGKKSEKLLKE